MSTITNAVIICEFGPKRLAMGLQQKHLSGRRDKVSRTSPNSLFKTNKSIWQQVQDLYITIDYSTEKLAHSTLLYFLGKKTFQGSYRN